MMVSLASVKGNRITLYMYMEVTSAASICMYHRVVTDQHMFARNI